MMTHTPRDPGSFQPLLSTGRLRLTTAAAAVSLAALAACSSETPVTQSPSPGEASTSTGAAVAAGETSSESSAAAPTSTTSTTTTAPPRTDKAVNATITVPTLGHAIVATKLSRNIPWPAGNPVAAERFEIVGVEMKVTAGSRYSADVKPAMFVLGTTKGPQPVAPATEFGSRFGKPLATAARGTTQIGWVFFKLDRGAGGDLRLTFKRPLYKVSTTNTTIPAADYAVTLR